MLGCRIIFKQNYNNVCYSPNINFEIPPTGWSWCDCSMPLQGVDMLQTRQEGFNHERLNPTFFVVMQHFFGELVDYSVILLIFAFNMLLNCTKGRNTNGWKIFECNNKQIDRDLGMNKLSIILKPLMPILAVAYAIALIYLTALPVGDNEQSFGSVVTSCLITLGAIGLTLYLIHRVIPRGFPSASRFTLKLPTFPVALGLLIIAPLWLVIEGYTVYGMTSLFHAVHLENITYTAEDMREDLLASIHAVLLAPVLEELCFRQMAISPFRRRNAQIAVCIIVAVLFGILHVRNFPGAFLGAMFYGMVFILSKNIWYGILLHAGRNLMVTLIEVYSWLGLGTIQMAKTPVIVIPDAKIIITSIVLALTGIVIIKTNK